MKTCTKCGVAKPATPEFWSPHKLTKDGFESRCKQCRREVARERYAADPEKARQRAQDWRDQNPDKVAESRQKGRLRAVKRQREYRAENIDKVREASRKWRTENKDKANATTAAWQRENKSTVNAKTARRRAAQIERTPPWLTSAQHAEMLLAYAMRDNIISETGIDHEVDHIVPLQGETISGLHVPWNLQVITTAENRSKSNKHEG